MLRSERKCSIPKHRYGLTFSSDLSGKFTPNGLHSPVSVSPSWCLDAFPSWDNEDAPLLAKVRLAKVVLCLMLTCTLFLSLEHQAEAVPSECKLNPISNHVGTEITGIFHSWIYTCFWMWNASVSLSSWVRSTWGTWLCERWTPRKPWSSRRDRTSWTSWPPRPSWPSWPVWPLPVCVLRQPCCQTK